MMEPILINIAVFFLALGISAAVFAWIHSQIVRRINDYWEEICQGYDNALDGKRAESHKETRQLASAVARACIDNLNKAAGPIALIDAAGNKQRIRGPSIDAIALNEKDRFARISLRNGEEIRTDLESGKAAVKSAFLSVSPDLADHFVKMAMR